MPMQCQKKIKITIKYHYIYGSINVMKNVVTVSNEVDQTTILTTDI